MDPIDLAMLVLRAWLAVVMLRHGWHHARSLDGTADWFASKGFRHAPLQARLSALGELSIGAAIGVGLLTSPAAAGLIATMIVAFWSIHRHAGFFVFARPDEGYEYVLTLVVAGFVLSTLGPGSVSVDALLDVGDSLNGWTGAGIAGAGLLAGAAQLAATWRRPANPDGS